MTFSNAVFTATTLLALGLGSPAAQSKIVCWKDNDGVRSCGNSVPPEFAQKSSKRISSQGVTIERTGRAKTGEELRLERETKKRQAEKEKEERRIATEQARKDRVLLQTYNTEDEMILARDGKIAVINSRIKHNQQVIIKLQKSLTELQNEAASLERGGKKVGENLRKELTDIQTRIEKRRKVNEQFASEQDEVREVFTEDLARYQKLKGTKGSGLN